MAVEGNNIHMRPQNLFYHITGIGFLLLANLKYRLKGYSSPKPFTIADAERCVAYDIKVVEQWLTHLDRYADGSVSGKRVLELGPGSDLGVGIYLLLKGALQYNAIDANNLVESVPDGFYELFFERIAEKDIRCDMAWLREELEKTREGKSGRLNYVSRSDFDLRAAFDNASIDIVFSQAAFEHFDDIGETISQLSAVCKPGAIVVAEIDLKTHTRWIRDKDPNNIYRYPDWIYNAFWFRGAPNRARPFQYKDAFERYGWTNISIIPLSKIADYHGNHSGMDRTFASDKNQMDYLSVMLCARKS